MDTILKWVVGMTPVLPALSLLCPPVILLNGPLLKHFCCCLQGELQQGLPTMDISEEMHYLNSCQQVFSPPKAVLQQIVIDAQGSMPTAVGMLLEWSHQSHTYDQKHQEELWNTKFQGQATAEAVASVCIGPDSSHARGHTSVDRQQAQEQLLAEAAGISGDISLHQLPCCISISPKSHDACSQQIAYPQDIRSDRCAAPYTDMYRPLQTPE